MSQIPPDTSGPNPAAAADDAAAAASASRMGQKVELDLDDAPFLQDEPEPEKKPEPKAAEPASAETTAAALPPAKQPLKDRLLANKKRLAMAGVSFMVLLAAGIGANSFLSGSPKPPPPPEPRKIVVPDAPKPLPVAPAPQYTLGWEPFWVEQKDTEGAIRFLVCRFTIPTDNPTLFAEMQQKKIILRDAFFYYLRNMPLTPLTSEAATRKLKTELMTVVNEHVGSGKVEDLYIEEYLIK